MHALALSLQHFPRGFEIGWAVDAFGKIFDRVGADQHAHFERAQLFEFLAQFER